MREYFKIFGLPETASYDEVKSARIRLLKKFHPDLYAGNKKIAQLKTAEINQAFEELTNYFEKNSATETKTEIKTEEKLIEKQYKEEDKEKIIKSLNDKIEQKEYNKKNGKKTLDITIYFLIALFIILILLIIIV